MARNYQFQPLPVDFVAHHPGAIALPVAGFGMLMRIVIYWWITDCRDLPTNNDRLAIIAHAHRPTWASHRHEIMRIFGEIKDDLLLYRQERVRRHATLNRLREKGVSAMKLKTLQKRNAAAPSFAETQAPRVEERNRAAKAPAHIEAPIRGGFVEKSR